jgi:hypothetical protein
MDRPSERPASPVTCAETFASPVSIPRNAFKHLPTNTFDHSNTHHQRSTAFNSRRPASSTIIPLSTYICTWAEPRLWALGAPAAPAAAIHGGLQLATPDGRLHWGQDLTPSTGIGRLRTNATSVKAALQPVCAPHRTLLRRSNPAGQAAPPTCGNARRGPVNPPISRAAGVQRACGVVRSMHVQVHSPSRALVGPGSRPRTHKVEVSGCCLLVAQAFSSEDTTVVCYAHKHTRMLLANSQMLVAHGHVLCVIVSLQLAVVREAPAGCGYMPGLWLF